MVRQARRSVASMKSQFDHAVECIPASGATIALRRARRAAMLRADLATRPLMLLARSSPESGAWGPTRREIDAAIRDLVATQQAVVTRGAGWTRIALKTDVQAATK